MASTPVLSLCAECNGATVKLPLLSRTDSLRRNGRVEFIHHALSSMGKSKGPVDLYLSCKYRVSTYVLG